MKKIIISILAITMCSSLSFGKSKIEGKKKLINSIPKKLIITKESTQEYFQKEILEIHNTDIEKFTLAVTIADTDSNIEGLEFIFLDDEMKFVVDKTTYNSLTELERSSLSNKIFAQKFLRKMVPLSSAFSQMQSYFTSESFTELQMENRQMYLNCFMLNFQNNFSN